MVFLNLPETREERVRREVREEVEQRRTEWRARVETWRDRMKEAQEKGERFDERPPWEE